jgi:hypothetical protein
MDEYLEDTDLDDLPIQNITECEHGKAYELKGSFTGTGEDVEFDGFYLVEVKDETKHN